MSPSQNGSLIPVEPDLQFFETSIISNLNHTYQKLPTFINST